MNKQPSLHVYYKFKKNLARLLEIGRLLGTLEYYVTVYVCRIYWQQNSGNIAKKSPTSDFFFAIDRTLLFVFDRTLLEIFCFLWWLKVARQKLLDFGIFQKDPGS